jgi:hypothetical protein
MTEAEARTLLRQISSEMSVCREHAPDLIVLEFELVCQVKHSIAPSTPSRHTVTPARFGD